MNQRKELTNAEGQRLEKYITENGGQQHVGVDFGVNASTLSRIIHKHHAPSPMLRKKLVAIGVILEQKRKLVAA